MNMKKAALALLAAAMLAGCGAANTKPTDSSEVLMTIDGQKLTRNTEYQLLKYYVGPNVTLNAVNKQIYAEEIGVTDDIKKEAEDTLAMYESDDFEEQLKSIGFDSKEEYMEEMIIPSLQAQALSEKYFTDAKEEIQAEFRPVVAAIIQTDSEDNANKALEALKNGDDPGKVGGTYAPEDATYVGTEQVVSTENTDLPTTLLNAILDAGKEEVLDQVYQSDTSTDDVDYYVAKIISTDYDANVEKIAAALGSNSTITTNCQVYYLKKYKFEVFDQSIFDYYKAVNPEYLVTRPDLSETDSEE